jgi:hypothetical protein
MALSIFSALFSEGDPVQFEAVPQEGNADDPASSYCSWFATLVWYIFYQSSFRTKKVWANFCLRFMNNF